MVKVQILDRFEHCEGEAYLPVGEAKSYTGERYTRYEHSVPGQRQASQMGQLTRVC